ncbi:MAG: hemerythrin family protein [Nitrospinae bacterium]|nr:hemerythrin family protein [Nitrospinota bacterium]
MPFYKWDETLATGIGDIDVQHQMIFVALNNFIEDCSKGKGKEAVKSILDFLADYVVKHFLIEERYMTTYSYPEYSSHKSQHAKFQQDFVKLRGQFTREGITSDFIESLKHRVGDWLINHIMVVDKALGQFLKTKIYHDYTKDLNVTTED